MSENTPVYEKILEELVDRDCGGHYAMVSSVFDHLDRTGNNEPWQLMVLEVLTIAIQHKVDKQNKLIRSLLNKKKERQAAQNAPRILGNVSHARLPSRGEKQAQNGDKGPCGENLGHSLGCKNTGQPATLNIEGTKDNDN